MNYSVNFNELINRYRTVIDQVFTLDVKDCGDRCIVRVLNWGVVDTLGSVHALMIDPNEYWELLRRPSLIGKLLRRGLRRLILYPCFGSGELTVLGRLGFVTINYVTSNNCALTKYVVMPPNAYDVVSMVRGGYGVYVHLYRVFTKQGRDLGSLFESFFEYLLKQGVRVNLILDTTLLKS
ncbi:hypothetical protein [Vulcanisaeta thermophila]|uniref:hypothetical protein n=1 Tax=Vulcanisaeta thermophila TaxID=867917 RepID=UPI0008529621|nr:hypothetical protein [Vulcanisaeta thermophila]